MPEPRKLRVSPSTGSGQRLCHSLNDKPAVRKLYQRLKCEGWIDSWLALSPLGNEEKFYPGQDWDLEIEKAVEASDAVIVFLSNNSVSKEGYVQRKLRFVLRIADFRPEGTLPEDKDHLLATLDNALSQGRDALRPEAWRGL